MTKAFRPTPTLCSGQNSHLRLRNRPPSTSRMYVSNSRACVPAGTAAERATAHWQHTHSHPHT